jgi:hypothetical protein
MWTGYKIRTQAKLVAFYNIFKLGTSFVQVMYSNKVLS